jgi:hypothetical protein
MNDPARGLRRRGRRSGKCPRSKPIDLLWRGVAANVRDIPKNPALDLDHALAPHRGADDYELLHAITKAAMQPASTVVSGWLSEVIGPIVGQSECQLGAIGRLRSSAPKPCS